MCVKHNTLNFIKLLIICYSLEKFHVTPSKNNIKTHEDEVFYSNSHDFVCFKFL